MSFSKNLLFFNLLNYKLGSALFQEVLHEEMYLCHSCKFYGQHTIWTNVCFSVKTISCIGLLKLLEFPIKFVGSLPSTFLRKIYKSTFHSFSFFLWVFSRTIETTILAQLTFSPFPCAMQVSTNQIMNLLFVTWSVPYIFQ